eukprot:gene8570-17680_t
MISSSRKFLGSIISNNRSWGSIELKSSSFYRFYSIRKAESRTSLPLTFRQAHSFPKSNVSQLETTAAYINSQIYSTITNLIEIGDRKRLWQYIDSNFSNLTIANILANSNEIITGKAMAGIIHSFKNIKYDSKDIEMNTLLSVLAHKLHDQKTQFNAKQF